MAENQNEAPYPKYSTTIPPIKIPSPTPTSQEISSEELAVPLCVWGAKFINMV